MRYLEGEESRLSLPAGCGRGGSLGDTYMEVVGRAFTVPVMLDTTDSCRVCGREVLGE